MKIATFNIQNLFYRHYDFFRKEQSVNSQNWMQQLDCLLRKQPKSLDDTKRIEDLSYLLDFEAKQNLPYALLKNKGGDLCFSNYGIQKESRASFLTNWEGWVKVMNKPLHEKSVLSKAYVIGETNPDVLILQQVEDRASLVEFNREFLPLLKVSPYEHIMVVETNDPRGMGMGIMLKKGFKLRSFTSYLDRLDSKGFYLFDLDTHQYTIETPIGKNIVILSNHFSLDERKRREQVEWVAAQYQKLNNKSNDGIIVCGTFNDVAYSDCLSPLLRETHLRDISRHERFKTDMDKGKAGKYFRMGAYRMGVNIKQRDYLLIPPSLSKVLRSAGMNRKGTWQDKLPNWSLYSSISAKEHAASEHPLIWANVDL